MNTETTSQPKPTFTFPQYPKAEGHEIRPFTFWKGKKRGETQYTGFLIMDIDHFGTFNAQMPAVVLCEIGYPHTAFKIPVEQFISLVEKSLFIHFIPAVV